MSDQKRDDVGPGRPPIEHRFKKGKSGNPEGARRHKYRRPDVMLRDLAMRVANEMVSVTIGRQTVRVPKKVAILIAIINDSLTGTPAHRLKAFKLLQSIGAYDFDPKSLVPDDKARRKFIEKLAAEATAMGLYTDTHRVDGNYP